MPLKDDCHRLKFRTLRCVQCSITLTLGLLINSAYAISPSADKSSPLNQTLSEPQARALLNRLGYGATPASLQATTGRTTSAYVMRAIQEPTQIPTVVQTQIARMPLQADISALWLQQGPGSEERRKLDEQGRKEQQREMNQYLAATVQARLLTMANSDNPGHEALLSFWLNHFSIFGAKGPVRLLAWDYIRAVEQAMRADSFEALLRASFKHPAMQLYLDNAQSIAPNSEVGQRAAQHGRAAGLNENLARELLELHTLGVESGYTQADVQALARIITGAGVYTAGTKDKDLQASGALREGLFFFDPRRHDFGSKIFLGEYFSNGMGWSEIDRALHMLAQHPATARHISTKLAQRFLADEPPPEVVNAMTTAYLRSQGRISATLLALVERPEFTASLQSPQKFKEPMDYLLSTARAACGDQPITHGLLLATSLSGLGQAPLMRSTPDGYGARESDWLSPLGMAKRVRIAQGAGEQRFPFAAAPTDAFQAHVEAGQDILRGQSCPVDETQLARAIGPMSARTLAQGVALNPRERATLWLASPEFMRR